MRTELPDSVRRHARRLAAITLLIHRRAKSQTESSKMFELYIGEFITHLQKLGASPDIAIEITLALSSESIDIMMAKLGMTEDSGSCK